MPEPSKNAQLLDPRIEIPLFSGLPQEHRRQIIRAMVARQFAPEEVVLQQGTVTQNLWLLVDGTCEVIKEPPSGKLARAVSLAEINPYETFGEMTLFRAAPHCTSVWAKTAVKTLKLRHADFQRLAHDQPATACELVRNLVNILSARLRRMDDWITSLLDEHQGADLEEQWTDIERRLQETFKGRVL